MNTNLFLKKSVSDTKELIKNYLDENRGDFFYFRHMSLQMQKRFMELMNHSEMPKVLLHGNPHIENYVITAKGAAMVDFDRSRIGPYAWDIVRFLASISLKKESEEDFFLSDIVLDYFLEGYLRGFYTPNLPFTPAKHITEKADFKVWYDSTEEFLDDNIKWAKKMRKDPVPSDDKTMQKILSGYLKSRNELGLLKEFEVSEAGKAMGTFGNKRYLSKVTKIK